MHIFCMGERPPMSLVAVMHLVGHAWQAFHLSVAM